MKEINCNESLTTDLADRYVKGLASSGSWILFDKVDQLKSSLFILWLVWLVFNFINKFLFNLDVLSSIGFQLDYLRNCIKMLQSKDSKDPTSSYTKINERVC